MEFGWWKICIRNWINKSRESKEYVVVLKWKNDTQNKGKKVNNVKIIDTQNEANFDETTLEDNEDNAVVELKIDKTVNDVIDDIKMEIERNNKRYKNSCKNWRYYNCFNCCINNIND